MATTTIKDGFNGGSDNQLKVNADGSINVDVSGGTGSNVNLTEVGGSTITLGQTTMANSLPVVIASNQSPIPVTGTFTATNPSVGTTGTTAPTSATEVGGINPSGNLTGLQTNASGDLLVQIAGVNPSQNSVLVYTQQTAVAVGVTTTVATYTAPASPTVACLLLVSVSGTNVAQWTITNSSTGVYDQNYTSAAQLNEVFTFETGSTVVPGQIIGAGNTITVSVNQIGTSAGNFGARIQVLEIG